MNWDAEVDIEGDGGVKVAVTLAEIQGLLLCNLTKDELEEFAWDLICAADQEGEEPFLHIY
jgi:hypothetical protein